MAQISDMPVGQSFNRYPNHSKVYTLTAIGPTRAREQRKKQTLTFHYTGWLIGILIFGFLQSLYNRVVVHPLWKPQTTSVLSLLSHGTRQAPSWRRWPAWCNRCGPSHLMQWALMNWRRLFPLQDESGWVEGYDGIFRDFLGFKVQ